jgi:GDP-L-fucose synthase
MEKHEKIYLAGHLGLVGSACMRLLQAQGFSTIITRALKELDLRRQEEVEHFFAKEQPAYVLIAAARVGGIYANATSPADFLYDNLMIATNIIHAAYKAKVKKLLFLGSSCAYPRDCAQPIKEKYLLTGPLEATNEGYALAKIAGIKLCQMYKQQYGANFISCMPTNLYGPGDLFDESNSHVVPALITKMIRACQEKASHVILWGTGTPRRDLLFVDDCAEALIFLLQHYQEDDAINIGSGLDYSIAEIAAIIQELVGFKGTLIFDEKRPDGTPRKILDIDCLMTYGWKAKTPLHDGLRRTIEWYKNNHIYKNGSYSLKASSQRLL